MAEPISLTEARMQCRILDPEDNEQDPLLASLIVAARAWVENDTGVILVRRLVTERFARFGAIELAKRPVFQAADVALIYRDATGAGVSYDEFGFVPSGTEAPMLPAILFPAASGRWPVAACGPGAVSVSYTAGWLTPDDVPQPLKQAMMLLIDHWFMNRGAMAIGVIGEIPFAVDALLSPYRLPVIG